MLPRRGAYRALTGIAAAVVLLTAGGAWESAVAANLATPTAVAGTATPAASPNMKESVTQLICRASCVWDPPSLATDAFTVHECPCPGAEPGMIVIHSLESYDVTDYTQIVISGARVLKSNWARFTLQNTGADTVDPGPLTIQYKVEK